MVARERIKQIVGILKTDGRMQRSKLIKRLEEEGIMSHQTASNTIDEAVKLHKIFRQEDFKGKQKIVWLDINQDIRKWEEQLFAFLEVLIKKYDEKFSIFKNKFSSLSLEEKADGVDAYTYCYRNLIVIVEELVEMFHKTSSWSNMLSDLTSMQKGFIHLASTVKKEEATYISGYLLTEHIADLEDASKDVDKYLKEINK